MVQEFGPRGLRRDRLLTQIVAEARATFTEDKACGFIPGTRLAPVKFAISHHLRVEVNARSNEAEIGKDAARSTLGEFGLNGPDSHNNNLQDAWLFGPGNVSWHLAPAGFLATA